MLCILQKYNQVFCVKCTRPVRTANGSCVKRVLQLRFYNIILYKQTKYSGKNMVFEQFEICIDYSKHTVLLFKMLLKTVIIDRASEPLDY